MKYLSTQNIWPATIQTTMAKWTQFKRNLLIKKCLSRSSAFFVKWVSLCTVIKLTFHNTVMKFHHFISQPWSKLIKYKKYHQISLSIVILSSFHNFVIYFFSLGDHFSSLHIKCLLCNLFSINLINLSVFHDLAMFLLIIIITDPWTEINMHHHYFVIQCNAVKT